MNTETSVPYMDPGGVVRGKRVVADCNRAVVWQASNLAFDRKVTQDDIGGLNLGFPG